MMLALCDDDPVFTGQLKNALIRNKQEQDTVIAFSSGSELLAYHSDTPYLFDLTFLDIEMPGMNGLEVAAQIRKSAPEARIVILTHHAKYALQAYNVHPLHYLIKPVAESKLSSFIEAARTRQEGDTYSFSFDRQHIKLPVRSIRYVESMDWMLYLHYGDTVYKLNERLKYISRDLIPKGFIHVHQSFLVNASHIYALDKAVRELTLTSGERIPISKSKMNETIRAFLHNKAGML